MKVFLLFALIFIPLVWFLIRALRYTNKTIGNDSPLHTIVTYRISAWHYFTQAGFITYLLIGPISILAPFFTITNLRTATNLWHYGLAAFSVVIAGLSFWAFFTLIQLHKRFWLITKGVTLTLDPSTSSIAVERFGSRVCLQPSTVRQITCHAAGFGSAKIFQGYGYYEFTNFNNQVTILNASPSSLSFAIDAYFKDVPQTYHGHKIPWPPVDVTHATAELC